MAHSFGCRRECFHQHKLKGAHLDEKDDSDPVTGCDVRCAGGGSAAHRHAEGGADRGRLRRLDDTLRRSVDEEGRPGHRHSGTGLRPDRLQEGRDRDHDDRGRVLLCRQADDRYQLSGEEQRGDELGGADKGGACADLAEALPRQVQGLCHRCSVVRGQVRRVPAPSQFQVGDAQEGDARDRRDDDGADPGHHLDFQDQTAGQVASSLDPPRSSQRLRPRPVTCRPRARSSEANPSSRPPGRVRPGGSVSLNSRPRALCGSPACSARRPPAN